MNKIFTRMFANICFVVALVSALYPCPSRGALLPPDYISAVVSLGVTKKIEEPEKPPVEKWVTVGTGFFYGYLVHNDPDVTKRRYAVFLVTAAHVIKGFIESNSMKVEVRIDAIDAKTNSEKFDIHISNWFMHPDADLAATQISIEFLKLKKLQNSFFASDEHSFTSQQMIDLGTSAGDALFVLGFPMGLSGGSRNYVIVRKGSVARISELLERASKTFLIDSFVFPGNSGGPVVTQPEIASIQGTKANQKAGLIGVVLSYEPYIDMAVSQQTKHNRISFEENSGLATVLPVDAINELVKDRAEAIWRAEQQRTAPAPLIFPTLPPASLLLPSPQNPFLQVPK